MVSRPLAGLVPVYFHLLMVGWVTQLIFGVAFWMFPRYSKEKPRGREGLAWAMYASLNAGLLLRGLAEPMHSGAPSAFLGGGPCRFGPAPMVRRPDVRRNMWKRIRGEVTCRA